MFMMQRNALKFLILGVSFLQATHAIGEEPLYPKETTIFFGNGILTQEDDAADDLLVLESRLLDKIDNNYQASLLTFEVAYNQSDAALDLVEALDQFYQSHTAQIWQMIAGINAATPTASGAIRAIIAENIAEMAEMAALANNPEVERHVKRYNKLLKACNRVVLVAHSQGNFFANIAYPGIEPTLKDAFGIVSVANPDSTVAAEGVYTTIAEDLIITPIPGSLPPNINNYGVFEIPSPWYGHAFVGNYLALGRPAEEKILNEIVGMIREVQSFDNMDYCGWPAIYADRLAIFREPYEITTEDLEIPVIGNPMVWDPIWQAASSGDMIIQFRDAYAGTWKNLTFDPQSGGGRWAHYRYLDPVDPEYENPPFVFVNNSFSTGGQDLSQTIEVQVDELHTGLQQYRFIVDNKVIEQFTVYQQDTFRNPVQTSKPILENLLPDSLLINPLP